MPSRTKQQLIERAKFYDEWERAADQGRPGHPGPAAWRKPRPPPATGHAALLRRLRKLRPDLHTLVMAGELSVGKAGAMAFSKPKDQVSGKPDPQSTLGWSTAIGSWSCSLITDDGRRPGGDTRARFHGQGST